MQVNNLKQKEEEFLTQLQNKLGKNTCPSTEDHVKKWCEVRDTPTRYYSRGSRLLFANAVLEQKEVQ